MAACAGSQNKKGGQAECAEAPQKIQSKHPYPFKQAILTVAGARDFVKAA
ncbi:MAG: hypothetical protein ABI634_10315 [Acidobacteriota bacterium]